MNKPTYTVGSKPEDWDRIPERMRGGLQRYIEHGVEPGGFMSALLSNDLRRTFERADSGNVECIRDYLVFLYNSAPSGSWGSVERFKAWIAAGGLNGMARTEEQA